MIFLIIVIVFNLANLYTLIQIWRNKNIKEKYKYIGVAVMAGLICLNFYMVMRVI